MFPFSSHVESVCLLTRKEWYRILIAY
jgi:hypothetical protein